MDGGSDCDVTIKNIIELQTMKNKWLFINVLLVQTKC